MFYLSTWMSLFYIIHIYNNTFFFKFQIFVYSRLKKILEKNVNAFKFNHFNFNPSEL